MFPHGTTADAVVLQAPSALDYIYGEFDMATFEHVRQQCLSNGKVDLVPVLAYWLHEQAPLESAPPPHIAQVAAVYDYPHAEIALSAFDDATLLDATVFSVVSKDKSVPMSTFVVGRCGRCRSRQHCWR